MLVSAERAHAVAVPELQLSGGARSQPAQSQSFAAELRESFGNAAKGSGRSASLPVIGQPVTRQDPVSSNSTSTGPSGLNGLVLNYPSSTPAGGSTTPKVSQPTPSFDQSYWASQPAAVQQLQNIQNPAQRAQLASQLEQQGYSIDVPVMVWGWDPATTMAARESYGYTWVPSAGQQPVESAPGLAGAGTSYDPNHPPSGSIPV